MELSGDKNSQSWVFLGFFDDFYMFSLISDFGMMEHSKKMFENCFINIKCSTFSGLSRKVIVMELSGEKNS